MKNMVITIDGPAGAGKSTVSKLLAKKLNYTYVDTGALYRGIALYIQRDGCNPDSVDCLKKITNNLSLSFKNINNELRLYNNDEDISDYIRSPEISMIASIASSNKIVRDYLLSLQRSMGKNGRVVFEGRDMGTVVFPNANLKFYLSADHKIRAQRRYNELLEKSNDISLERVSNEMQKRDEEDSKRELAPLKPAHDAIHIDSTGRSVEEVIVLMFDYFKKA